MAFDGLLEGNSDQWAFGTDFDDPLAGLDVALPAALDPLEHARFCLGLADDALILSQRLAEWCSRAPDLEDDVALANLALDLLGQARLLLGRAALVDPAVVPVLPAGSPVPAEDALAFFRDAAAFRNVQLVELPNGDFAHVIVRLLMFSVARLELFQQLLSSADPVLAAVAARGVKELAYQRDWAGRWFVTLARGTSESRRRVLAALAGLWVHQAELAEAYGLSGGAVLERVFLAGGVAQPDSVVRVGGRGRDGMHTEALSLLLAEMQVVARAHPMGRW
ncbi:1,2-phenylacetyl-CoA epoxidase subunit PaaC [Kineosporia babensis]|uniref:Phenylacetate-CoA oxygenase subunit PaaC n=1 Tax=Kineosporia babensis TaxID=499548 RepID=A0A9X1NLZ0_9ACTN|nr:1,2-phenylacetyl-CoA epoxidase subunit PaaC [Kineosporia babensis]MCD5315561.1 phenylacetate-CoA oxygenase subunit PaaC [Kineosporia babensis]